MKLSSFGLAKYNKLFPIWNYQLDVFPAGGISSVVRALEWRAGCGSSISGAGPMLTVLKNNWETKVFAPQTARPFRDSNDQVKWRSFLH